MDPDQIIELVSIILTSAGALGLVAWKLIGYINKVDEKRSNGVRELYSKIDRTESSLDIKFNEVTREVSSIKDNYVRRDDLNAHLARFEKNQEQQTQAIDRLRNRFDEWFPKLIETLTMSLTKERKE